MKGVKALGAMRTVMRTVMRAAVLAVAVAAIASCGDVGGGAKVADAPPARVPESRLPESRMPESGAPGRAPGREEAVSDRRNGGDASVGFRSRVRLAEHFAKHGREFGDIDMGEYLRRAQALRDAPVARGGSGGDVLELVRADGVVSRFDRRSGAFIAFDGDGTIRTFFRPNDGEAYFRRQGRRRPMR